MRCFFLGIFIIAFLSGCVEQSQRLYTWEGYSSTLYQMKKNPCDETRQSHMTELKKIIDISNEQNMRVPPGVYCEYGYLLMLQGKKDDGWMYFAMEEQAYPESAPFITHLKEYLTRADQKDRVQPVVTPSEATHPAEIPALATAPEKVPTIDSQWEVAPVASSQSAAISAASSSPEGGIDK